MSVFCKYATKPAKEASAKTLFNKPFASLTGIEKRTATDAIKGEWLPSTLTCESLESTECPAPEQCKGDLFFNPRPGVIAKDQATEMADRLRKPGTNLADESKEKAFQHQEGYQSNEVEPAR